jgi:hypothetical protein
METAATTVMDQYDITDHEVASKTARCESKTYDESLSQYFTELNLGVRSACMIASAQCRILTAART